MQIQMMSMRDDDYQLSSILESNDAIGNIVVAQEDGAVILTGSLFQMELLGGSEEGPEYGQVERPLAPLKFRSGAISEIFAAPESLDAYITTNYAGNIRITIGENAYVLIN